MPSDFPGIPSKPKVRVPIQTASRSISSQCFEPLLRRTRTDQHTPSPNDQPLAAFRLDWHLHRHETGQVEWPSQDNPTTGHTPKVDVWFADDTRTPLQPNQRQT